MAGDIVAVRTLIGICNVDYISGHSRGVETYNMMLYNATSLVLPTLSVLPCPPCRLWFVPSPPVPPHVASWKPEGTSRKVKVDATTTPFFGRGFACLRPCRKEVSRISPHAVINHQGGLLESRAWARVADWPCLASSFYWRGRLTCFDAVLSLLGLDCLGSACLVLSCWS